MSMVFYTKKLFILPVDAGSLPYRSAPIDL